MLWYPDKEKHLSFCALKTATLKKRETKWRLSP
jgi:hypothetical protein